MSVLKSSLCLKCPEPGGSLNPERPSGNALGHLIQVTLTYFLLIVFIASFSLLSVSRCQLCVRKGQPGWEKKKKTVCCLETTFTVERHNIFHTAVQA